MNPETTLTPKQITTIFKEHGLAELPEITRITVGFTNEVYQVDDYILKVCVKEANEPNFRKEEFLYELLQATVPVPHIVVADDSRTLLNKPYMIYRKLPGEPVATHWHKMTNEQRRALIKTLCMYLKAIDTTPLEQYNEQLHVDPHFSWQEHVCSRIDEKLIVLAKQKLLPDATIAQIKAFIEENKHVLREQPLGLTFWDVHFDNILVNDNYQLSGLIDFESIDVYPIDYRLMTVDIMQRYPQLYLSEEVEPFAKKEDYEHIMDWYEEFYPELFAFPDIEKRIDFYDLLDIVSKLPEWPTARNLWERLTVILDSKCYVRRKYGR
ncbi:MAG TPA: phosphotransferase [Candidatus Chromulinivoraceae bacterium]|nr:phosphotransferase [Candidatus Chromulinivoraceae bacterium]